MARRLSTVEKGKEIVTGDYIPPRKARVRIEAPTDVSILQQHSLTLIGRVTNNQTQKVWNLIPFFTEHWRTTSPPVGADLGQGVFKFQFASEEDLMTVLENRPYHYGRWMIILQRWEPTLSPSFPSLIPFWIKVQGIPIHLWTEGTLRSIGGDIGWVEKVDITNMAARMRVHVNGRLPLIKSSVLEYSSGDEVTVTLVYEKLEKHCLMCSRLDHDVKDCLEAKAQKRAQAEQASRAERPEEREKTHPKQDEPSSTQDLNFRFGAIRRDSDYQTVGERNKPVARREDRKESHPSYRSRDLRRDEDRRRRDREFRAKSHELESQRHRSERQATHRKDYRTGPYMPRDPFHRHQPVYKEVAKINTAANREEPARDKSKHIQSEGAPREESHDQIPREAVETAMGQIRDYMAQYANVADPTESEARRERVRRAEEEGQIEETATAMVRTALEAQTPPPLPQAPTEKERLPATRRISLPRPDDTSQERIPATMRISAPASQTTSQGRGPIKSRLGSATITTTADKGEIATTTMKRKPGRPPGRRTVRSSPKTMATGANPRKKKAPQTKAPSCKRKLISDTGTSTGTAKKIPKPRHSRATDNPEEPSESEDRASDNQPIKNLLTQRKKAVDFQNPPNQVP